MSMPLGNRNYLHLFNAIGTCIEKMQVVSASYTLQVFMQLTNTYVLFNKKLCSHNLRLNPPLSITYPLQWASDKSVVVSESEAIFPADTGAITCTARVCRPSKQRNLAIK